MSTSDPIRLSDFRQASGSASTISRAEAERQFKFSFALVIVLTLGTLVSVAALPLGGWENGYGVNPQVASTQAADTRHR